MTAQPVDAWVPRQQAETNRFAAGLDERAAQALQFHLPAEPVPVVGDRVLVLEVNAPPDSDWDEYYDYDAPEPNPYEAALVHVDESDAGQPYHVMPDTGPVHVAHKIRATGETWSAYELECAQVKLHAYARSREALAGELRRLREVMRELRGPLGPMPEETRAQLMEIVAHADPS